MPHVLVAGKLHPSGIALLAEASGFTFDYVEEVSEPSYAPLVGKADALVIRTQPLSAPTLAEAPRLKVVSRHGVGYDAVDLAALNARKIALAVVGDVNSVSVAEHAMMLILAASKRLIRADRALRAGAWRWRDQLEASDLAGKRLLIVGYGRIGRRLATMAAGFSLQLRAYDPVLQQTGWPDGPAAPMADLRRALAWADIVSIHVPGSDRPLLGPAELAAMKPGAILINTARGGVIDEGALVAALRSGRIAAAGIDVFDGEPPSPDDPLLGLDQVVVTPHNAGLSAQCAERMSLASVRNVIDFFSGTIDRRLVVNAEKAMAPVPAGN